MNPSWSLSILVAASWTSGAAAQNAAPEALTRKVRELCDELSAAGMKLSPDATSIEVLPQAEFEAGLAREYELVFGAARFDDLRVLREALTLDAGKTSGDLRARLAHSAAHEVVCRYDFERGKLTVVAPMAATAVEATTALEHELARARRDQQSDLVKWFDTAPRTTEMARLRQCLLEGEAEFASLALLQTRAGKRLENLKPENAVGLATLPTDDAALRLARAAGRDLWAREFHEQSWKVLDDLWANPPTSTEQVLHPLKQGKDLPRAVEFAPWPEKANVAEVVHEDTLGELELLSLLFDAGVERSEAETAAIGWDGDRMQLLRSKSGDTAVVWRIVFDRSEDVRQFATAWNREALGQMGATGFVFDWVRSDSVRFANALGDALLATVPKITVDENDRNSTQELERGVHRSPENEARVANDRWIQPRYGFSMPVPENWGAQTMNGQMFLVGEQHGDFRDLIGVVALENPNKSDLAALLVEHRANITRNEQAKLVLAEQRKIGGRDVIYLRYDVIPDETKLLHMTSVVFLSGAKQVIVTATLSDIGWSSQEPLVEAALKGLEFQVAPVPATPARKDGR